MPRSPFHPRTRAFTLIELLVVIAIIAILAGITIPAVKSLSKSNDQSQAINLVRSMISNARGIALAQHRMAGIVFFEETPAYSLPVNSNQTAMQLFVEDYNPALFAATWNLAIPPVATPVVYYSSMRQYLPAGVKLAALTDAAAGGNVETGDTSNLGARAILFDANGDLVLRAGLFSPQPNGGAKGTSPTAYGDWLFLGTSASQSAPGFFLYNIAEYSAQPPGSGRAQWLRKNSSVIIVNANTGGVLR